MNAALHCQLDFFHCQAWEGLSAEEYKRRCEASAPKGVYTYTQEALHSYVESQDQRYRSRAPATSNETFPLEDNDKDFELILNAGVPVTDLASGGSNCN